jgi:hypothetical protein
MIKKLTSEKGASSIMVVLLLVVLLVFGIAALTTALSSARLGQKVKAWDSTYYTAEKEANEDYAAIDKAVSEALVSGGDAEAAVRKSLSALKFETTVTNKDGKIYISYEVKNEDISISVALSLDPGDKKSLRPVQWKEKQ